MTDDVPLLICTASIHGPGIYSMPKFCANPRTAGVFSVSSWTYVPLKPSSLICLAPVAASAYDTSTDAEVSKLSLRLQQAALQSSPCPNDWTSNAE